MTTPDPALTLLEARFARLEAGHRAIRRRYHLTLLGLGLLALTVPLLGADENPLTRFRDLSVESLTIRDKDGKPRMQVALSPEGELSQRFLDGKGTERIQLAVIPDGTARIRLLDTDGKRVCGMAAFADHSATQQLFDPKGQLRIDQTISADGVARHQIHESSGKVRFLAFAHGTGRAGTETYDPQGNRRIAAITDADGDVTHNLYEAKGQLRIDQSVNADGVARHQIRDTAGKVRFLAFSHGTGLAGSEIFDPKGTRRLASYTAPLGTANQLIYDAKGERRGELLSEANGSLSQVLLDSAGHRAIGLNVEPGESTLVLAADNKVQVEAFAAPRSVTGLRLYDSRVERMSMTIGPKNSGQWFSDKSGKTRVAVTLGADGRAGLELIDPSGDLKNLIATRANGEMVGPWLEGADDDEEAMDLANPRRELGVTGQTVGFAERNNGTPNARPALKVLSVAPGSPAAVAGLVPGMIIVQYDRFGIGSMEDLRNAIIEGGSAASIIAYDQPFNGQSFQYSIQF